MANSTTAYRENLVSLSFWQHIQLFFSQKHYLLKEDFQLNKSDHINENLNSSNIQNVDITG